MLAQEIIQEESKEWWKGTHNSWWWPWFKSNFLLATTFEGNPICELWYRDSSCSNHMSGHKEWLTVFDPRKVINFILENNTYLVIEGICDIVINTKDGKMHSLKNILHTWYDVRLDEYLEKFWKRIFQLPWMVIHYNCFILAISWY